jgi:hypothetical protein
LECLILLMFPYRSSLFAQLVVSLLYPLYI